MPVEKRRLRQRIAARLQRGCFRALNLLHRPFVRRGADDPVHEVFRRFVALAGRLPAPRILEIGARYDAASPVRGAFAHCRRYVGFDIHPGDGVDVVGDAHRLSEHFPADHFDLVLSISVFEHLLFPWKAVLETNRILKSGGHVYLQTHPSWPAHELPWDFWRFPAGGFQALFNRYTGFEIVALSEGLPSKPYSLVDDPPTRGVCLQTLNQGVAVIARKVGDYREDLLRWDVEVSDVLDSTYPKR